MLNQPYIMVFAVASSDQIVIYTTNSVVPVAVVKNVHLDSINDLTWITDAKDNLQTTLIAASSDGFCSFFQLDLGTLCKLQPCDSSVIPEELLPFYEERSKVNFENSIQTIQRELDMKGA